MDILEQLEQYSVELSTAVQSLGLFVRGHNHLPSVQSILDLAAPRELHEAREAILSNVAKTRALLWGPRDMLKHAASEVSISSC
jgi:hypothetical protein